MLPIPSTSAKNRVVLLWWFTSGPRQTYLSALNMSFDARHHKTAKRAGRALVIGLFDPERHASLRVGALPCSATVRISDPAFLPGGSSQATMILLAGRCALRCRFRSWRPPAHSRSVRVDDKPHDTDRPRRPPKEGASANASRERRYSSAFLTHGGQSSF